MSNMPQNFFNDYNVSRCGTYQVSSPCKVFNLLAVAMSDKTPLDLWGGVNPQPPLWGAMDTTFHSSEK